MAHENKTPTGCVWVGACSFVCIHTHIMAARVWVWVYACSCVCIYTHTLLVNSEKAFGPGIKIPVSDFLSLKILSELFFIILC